MFYQPITTERLAPAQAVSPDVARGRSNADRHRLRGLDAATAESLARNTTWLGGISIVCMLTLLWALDGGMQAERMAGWGVAVVAANWLVILLRRRGNRAFAKLVLRSRGLVVLENGIHAAVWAALPLLVGDRNPPGHVLPLLAVAMVTMLAGSVLLALVPAAAIVWAALLGSGLLWMLLSHGAALPAGLLALLPVFCATLLIGGVTAARMVRLQHAIADREREARESIGMLLKEYEDQGVGWLWQIDADNRLVYVSPRICVLLGRSTSQLIGQSLPVVLGCDVRLGTNIDARQPFSNLEVEVATPAGPRWISLSGSPIVDADGGCHGFRGVGTDVTDFRRGQDRLTQLASTDVLTGLPNRQRLREILADGIAMAERTDQPCAILFLDLDGFKPVNDTFGHSVGDAVLRTVAQRLKAEVGPLGQIGRVGGDEFALVLSNGRDIASVERLADAIIDAIAEPFLFDKGEIRIGVSIGCAFAPADGVSIDDLLLKADLALYEAKNHGRGTFRLFDARMQHEAEAQLRLEQDLRKALDRGQFRIAYQPIVSATTLDLIGFEALLRWHHPQRGTVPPSVFIPLAEDMRLIGTIGAWVMQQACRDAAAWPDGMAVSVNVSPRQLLDPTLPHAVGDALFRAGLQPDRLELEVTEGVFMGDSDGSLDVLRRLRAIGVGIALDDFGTGYSSLGYLNKTIFHTLKIDGSFVRDAATKSETNAIIGAIVSLANSFRMQITAEGIETSADLERMRDFGCHKLQGYLFGKPMWHEDTLPLVAERRRLTA
ncbi:MAG TPA: EAL domain-containing protein [Sphingomonas sp.]|jgi:diguanylate cyclase (GGDEF)-like protein|uniref:putative bifunctional diguanylate cyclase/phosphodiesterase n=1 Tax=Sphingomonas sp. TaxID=28214 RepID=UPI002ED84816